MYVAGADRAKVDFAVDVSRREHDKHAAAFAVATCRAKPRFAFVGITDDARAIVAQNGLDFRDRHALRAFWLDFRRPKSNFMVVCAQMRVQNQRWSKMERGFSRDRPPGATRLPGSVSLPTCGLGAIAAGSKPHAAITSASGKGFASLLHSKNGAAVWL